MYTRETELAIADALDPLYYSLNRIGNANHLHQPATVVRLSDDARERLAIVAALASKTIKHQPQHTKDPTS